MIAAWARFPLSTEFLRDVLTSICESSPDTASWATATKIERDSDGYVSRMRMQFDLPTDNEGDLSGRGWLSYRAVARGISVALMLPDLNDRIRGAICGAAASNDAGGDFDGECADIIAQCALLGKVVYG